MLCSVLGAGLRDETDLIPVLRNSPQSGLDG